VRRLPVRWRLTLVFAGAMAVVLVAAGWFVHQRVASDLVRSLDQELRSRAQDVSALVRHGGSLRTTQGSLVEQGESFGELLDARGRVLDATPPIAASLLGPAELARARHGAVWANRPSVPGLDEGARLLAVPVGGGRVLVVGATKENRAETLSSLRAAFLVGGPLVLLLAAFGGYLLAGAALRPLEEGLARERRLVEDASHELRTPLASLRAELELALRRPRSATELEQAIVSAAEEADRLARIADSLLLLAGSEHAGLALRVEPLDAGDLLRAVAGRFEAPALRAGRTVQVEASAHDVVAGDSLRLEQALGNMVENALRHGAGSVVLRAEGGELHVLDEGAGFAPAFLGRAFERFSRADEAREGEGTGLGLAIVEAIARAHGGTAGIGNRPHGADVWIALPARPGRASGRKGLRGRPGGWILRA
jgi:two-component system OmpR family sensor kinase